ncbi:hypothetical protein [Acinetobacter radioresistens]|uniref:hypothetical protein n=1 Tax=Acinetobacter radioresistens TaxID=40216 RepID=UPI002002AD83|nr:hypothetical protein [Acinetobacter radioresistens]MCK4108890.1 hypothetical protein [Acinetobacter radioresistens]
MDLINQMFKDLEHYAKDQERVKYLHNKYQEDEKFVFLLGDTRYALEKRGTYCFVKINHNIQNISLDVFQQTIENFEAHQVLIF